MGRDTLSSAGWHDCEMVQVSPAPVVSTEDCSEKLTESRNGNGTHTCITSQEGVEAFFGIGFSQAYALRLSPKAHYSGVIIDGHRTNRDVHSVSPAGCLIRTSGSSLMPVYRRWERRFILYLLIHRSAFPLSSVYPTKSTVSEMGRGARLSLLHS